MTLRPDGPLNRTPAGKPRARALGIPFAGRPGPWNAITDVPGVELGYATLIEGDAVRTGVTAIHPRGKQRAGDPCAAGFHAQNGNGEMTGVSWIAESGTVSGPIGVTNTHAVGVVHAAAIRWITTNDRDLAGAWLLPVVGETWDGYLNDTNGGHVTEVAALDAIESAASGPVEEGSVGGGTGMSCYEFKGGSGTASRVVAYGSREFTVGVFVQANFGVRSELTIAGAKLGLALADDNPIAEALVAPRGAGSCIAIVITDAPLLPDQCRALARRVTLGLARTGTTGSHFSGDLFLALSVGNLGAFTPGFSALAGQPSGLLDSVDFIPWGFLDPFFAAVVEATEEAVVNTLVANEPMVGFRGHRVPNLPRDRVVELLGNRRTGA